MRNPLLISYSALVVVESVWWFATLAVIGGVLGLGGSPIPWVALLALSAIGIVSSWVLGGSKGDATTIALLQGVVALLRQQQSAIRGRSRSHGRSTCSAEHTIPQTLWT